MVGLECIVTPKMDSSPNTTTTMEKTHHGISTLVLQVVVGVVMLRLSR